MSKDVAIPVVIDTNILIPSIFMTTPILKFIIMGNLVPVWSHFIFSEANRILDMLWHEWYSKRMRAENFDKAKEALGYCSQFRI